MNEHQKMVSVLAKDPNKILESLDESKCHLLHMAIGIADEFFEYELAELNKDNDNMAEELGDLLFYIEGIGIRFGFTEDWYKSCEECSGFIANSTIKSMMLLNQTVKRHVFYEQDLDVETLKQVYLSLKSMVRHYAMLALGLTLKEISEANMKKLAKRYDGFKYSDERAKERVDKK